MCDVKPCETFLARGRIYLVTEDTSEFPDERIRAVVLCVHKRSCVHICACVYVVGGKMEGFSVSIAFPLMRARLHQQGKKKLIPTLSQREPNSGVAQRSGMFNANCILSGQLLLQIGLILSRCKFVTLQTQRTIDFNSLINLYIVYVYIRRYVTVLTCNSHN